MDELRGERESIGAGIGDGRGFLFWRSGHGSGGKGGRRRRMGNLCGPRIGLVQAESCFTATIVVIGVDVEDLLVRAGEGSSRWGRAGLVRRAL